jgi:predicted CXXCH cytochrome family protein
MVSAGKGKGHGVKLTLIILAVSLTAAGHAYSAEKHECSYCHVVSGKTPGAALKAPLSGLCFGCHPDRKNANEHKVDMVPSMKVEGLPLAEDGRMTCVTCHDPHEKSGHPKLLRLKQSELCLKCHFR